MMFIKSLFCVALVRTVTAVDIEKISGSHKKVSMNATVVDEDADADEVDPCEGRTDQSAHCNVSSKALCMQTTVLGKACMWADVGTYELEGVTYNCADGTVFSDSAGAAGVYQAYADHCCNLSEHRCN